MPVYQEFKAFVSRGHVVDLAVAVVLGGAFGKIVTAMVNGLVMPLMGSVMPKGDWQAYALGPFQVGQLQILHEQAGRIVIVMRRFRRAVPVNAALRGLAGAVLCFAVTAYPCSVFSYSSDGKVWFCGNEDWTSTDPALLTIPSEKGTHGLALLGWKRFLPAYPQAGVNDAGLAFDWAAVPPTTYPIGVSGPVLTVDSLVEILKTCATVSEAVAYVRARGFAHLAEEHLMFADRSGASCVLEWSKGKMMVVERTGHAQWMTNFVLSEPERGWYPCARYEALGKRLTADGLRESDLVSLLDAVHQTGNYPTAYSYVIELISGSIALYVARDYSKAVRFSFGDLMGSRELVDLRSRSRSS